MTTSWTKPTPEQVEKAVATLGRAEQRRYFFDKLQNPHWVGELNKKGFFAKPPAPERNESEKTIRFAPWEESKYLARMAKHVPDEVADILVKVQSTDNMSVHDDILDAAAAMPPRIAAKLIEKEIQWITSQPWLYGLYEDKGVALLRHLLGEPDGRQYALKFAKAFLALRPDSSSKLLKRARPKFDDYSYAEVVSALAEPFTSALGDVGVTFLADLLETALRLASDKRPEDYSYIWRPAIEDHERNDLRDNDPGSALITAVRDAALAYIKAKPDGAERLIDGLFNRKWRAFRRLSYFLALVLPKGSPLLRKLLVNREALEDIGSQHEYTALLNRKYADLDENDKKTIVSWILDGPTYLKPDDEHYQVRLGRWQTSHLHLIRDALNAEQLEKYKALVKAHGESEPPDFPFKVGAGWVGPTSPFTKEELGARTDSEIVDLLKSWVPERGMFATSRRGLGRVMEALISEQPERVSEFRRRLSELNPTYVTALLAGLTSALGKGASLDWPIVLEIATWVSAQSFERGEEKDWDEGDTDWSNSRREVVKLLKGGMRADENPIPFALRKLVWDALYPITKDPDPTPEYEEKYGGMNMGPSTLALNSNRGEAMEAVIGYGLWVKKNLERSSRWLGFDSAPELATVLADHLDVVRDPSVAVRSVYGQWFPWLHLMDSAWAKKRRDEIFVHHDQKLWEVAWNTYVTHVIPYNDMLDVLRDHYVKAIANVGKTSYPTDYVAEPDERLAEHIVVFLLRRKLDFEDDLVKRLWAVAAPNLRHHIINFLARSLDGEEKPPSEIIERMHEIWIRRFKASTVSGADTTELKAFGTWFAAKNEDPEWALPQLLNVLRLQPDVDMEFLVLKRLAEVSSTRPAQAVEALRLLVTGRSDMWRMGIETQAIRAIVANALTADIESQEAARTVVDHFGKNGIHHFRDLWPGSK